MKNDNQQTETNMKRQMHKRMLALMVLAGLLAGLSASAGIVVFSDDFSGTLDDKWYYDGNANITDGKLVLEPVAGEPWHAAATTKPTFSNTSNYYNLEFSTNANGGVYGQVPGQERVIMPGGLGIDFANWGSPASVSYKGTKLDGDVTGSGSESGGYRTLNMVMNGLDAAIYVNGTLGWSGTLPTAPDFSAYDRILLWGQYAVTTNAYEYVQMSVPEPATLGLLALGGLALIRRRR